MFGQNVKLIKNGDLKEKDFVTNVLSSTFANLEQKKTEKSIEEYSVFIYGVEADPKVCLKNVFGPFCVPFVQEDIIHDLESQDEVEFMSEKNASKDSNVMCYSNGLFSKKTGKLLNKVKTNDFKTSINRVKNLVRQSSNDKCVIIFVELFIKACYFIFFFILFFGSQFF